MIEFRTGQEKVSSDPESVFMCPHSHTQVCIHINLYRYRGAVSVAGCICRPRDNDFSHSHNSDQKLPCFCPRWHRCPLSLWQWPARRTPPGATLSSPCSSRQRFCSSRSSCWRWNVTAAEEGSPCHPADTQGKPFPALLDFHAIPWHLAQEVQGSSQTKGWDF